MSFLRKTRLAGVNRVFWVAAGMLIPAVLVITTVGLNQPKPVELSDPQAQEISFVLNEAERLFGEVGCNPSVDVDVLDTVLADWSGYRPSGSAWNMVVRVYGQSAAANAGFLTERKAYYRSIRGDYSSPNATPANGLRPTARPNIYCPPPAPDEALSIKSIVIGLYRAVARYAKPSSLNEAVLIFVDGRWKIASLKYLQLYF